MSKLIFSPAHTKTRYTDDVNKEPDKALLPADLASNFTWTGREDYLEWVADWKTRLHAMIADIRQQKAARPRGTDEARCAAASACFRLRIDAYNLLLLRRIGKRLSAQQRESITA
jgi:hypothetical protein